MSAQLKPRVNPDEAVTWPFVPTVKRPGDLVLTNIGTFHDRFCRCRGCKPSLIVTGG